MSQRNWVALGLAGILCAVMTANGKNKEKPLLPEIVLKAQTVLVVILPDTGEPVNDPAANNRAQQEVEKALIKWGRFHLTMDVSTADLVIGVKRGTDRPVTPTMSGGPVDNAPVGIEQTDGTVRISGKQGRPTGDVTQNGDPNGLGGRPRMGAESGSPDDVFQVYRGGVQYPMDSAPIWSYTAKNGLKPPAMTAVEEFHKAIDQTEKAMAQKQKQQQSQQQGAQKSP